MSTFVAAIFAGAAGAVARFVLDGWLQRRTQTDVPTGTLVINVSGAFALGVVVGLGNGHHLPTSALTIVGTGFLGAFTTFSTFTFEAIRLAEEAAWQALRTYLAITVVGGLLAAWLGLVAATVV